MRWWPKPMRIVPTTIAPALAPHGVAPSRVPSLAETRRPLTNGESDSPSGIGTVLGLAPPTFMRCRNATLALSIRLGSPLGPVGPTQLLSTK